MLKILLICAGGASTSILMKKMQKYAESINLALEMNAKGIGNFEDYSETYDVILLGPQISYKRAEIEAQSQKPIAVITPYDYATGNAENIFKQVNAIIPDKKKQYQEVIEWISFDFNLNI